MNPNRSFPTAFTLWFVFLTLITIHAPGCHAQTAEFTNCSSTIQCGSLPSIGYPFWGGNRANYCGNGTEYQLTCVSNTSLEMTLSGLTYRVLDYLNSTRTVTVARNDYYSNICPQYLHNVSSISPFSYSDSTITNNLTLFYNCPAISTLPSVLGQGSSFTCENYNSSSSNITGYFITVKASDIPGASQASISLGSCVNNVVLPVSLTALLKIQTSATAATVEASLKEGFGLVWPDDGGACQGCTQSGGQCGTDSDNNDAFVCYCSDKSYSSTCPSSSPSPSSPSSGGGGGE